MAASRSSRVSGSAEKESTGVAGVMAPASRSARAGAMRVSPAAPIQASTKTTSGFRASATCSAWATELARPTV
jgi:hypothetical protein